MTIGILKAQFSLPEAHSLKDKRRCIKSLKDRTVARMNMSVGETAKQDFWKGAELTFVTVAGERKFVEKRFAELSRILQTYPGMVLMNMETTYL